MEEGGGAMGEGAMATGAAAIGCGCGCGCGGGCGCGCGCGIGTGATVGSTICFATYGAAAGRSCLRDLEGVFPMLMCVPVFAPAGHFSSFAAPTW